MLGGGRRRLQAVVIEWSAAVRVVVVRASVNVRRVHFVLGLMEQDGELLRMAIS
jgi:hypothetical protein